MEVEEHSSATVNIPVSDGRHISWLNRIINNVKCPKDGKRMKRVDCPWMPVWECSCGWKTWYKSKENTSGS